MSDSLHFDDLPFEIHEMVIQQVGDGAGYSLQLFPDAGKFQFPHSPEYQYHTMSRIRLDTLRPELTRLLRREMDEQEADLQRYNDFLDWKTTTNPESSIMSLMNVDSKRLEAVGRYLRSVDTPVQISTPGIPYLGDLTDLQRSIVEKTSTLIFRHSPLSFLADKTSEFLTEFKGLKYIMIPSVAVTAEMPLRLWDGKMLATGVFLGDAYAHEILVRAVSNLIPDWLRRKSADVSKSKVSIVVEVEIKVRDPSKEVPHRPRGSLLVVAARDITDNNEEPYIISVRWADNWKHNQYTSQYNNDTVVWTRNKREMIRYERHRKIARPEATKAEITASMGSMFLSSLFMVKPRFREIMVENWEHWKAQNISVQQLLEAIDFRFRYYRWKTMITTTDAI